MTRLSCEPSEGAPAIERVLCALDVQHPILSAVSLAGLIAERFGAALEVLYAEAAGGNRRFQTNGERVEELMASHNMDQRLQQLVEGRGSPASTTTQLIAGNPVASILERIEASRGDLIVLGARQRSDLGWQFRDDIARQVAALAQCATLTVHERESANGIERILVPVDSSPVTERAVAWAGAFARRFAAEVHVLHVVTRGGQAQRTTDRSQQVRRSSSVPSAVSARVAELAEGLASAGVRAKSEVMIAGSVVNGITDCNDRGEFDLLVLGINGLPKGPARFTRNLAATLRNRVSIPLLSVRQVTSDSPASASRTGDP
jgi:nucleotide-binding universal stress UspA family protein